MDSLKLTKKQLAAFLHVLAYVEQFLRKSDLDHPSKWLPTNTSRANEPDMPHHSVIRKLVELNLLDATDDDNGDSVVTLNKPSSVVVFCQDEAPSYPYDIIRLYKGRSEVHTVISRTHHAIIVDKWERKAQAAKLPLLALPHELLNRLRPALQGAASMDDPQWAVTDASIYNWTDED